MQQRDRVLGYYDATHIDYRALWSGSTDRAIHFGYYDDQATSHRQAVLRLNAVVAEALSLTTRDHLLDAGCGYGGSATWMANHIGCSVTGITLVPSQVERARRYASERGIADSVRFHEMDYQSLTFADQTFDAYCAIESLVHASERQQAINESYRVLKPGGRIAIAEYTLRETPALTADETRQLEPWLQGWAMPRLLTPGEYVAQLSQAGYVNISVRNITAHIRPSLKRLELLSVLTYPIATLIAPWCFRRERLENYRGCWSQIRSLKRDLWEYSLITAAT